MKPKDAFGRYGCVPRNLHPAWFSVGWSARAIGKALFVEVDDFETCRIDVHGDWRDSLCKRLCIDGKERRFAKPALDALVAAGLLTVGTDFVTVNVRPTCGDSTVNALSTDSDGPSKSTEVLENVKDTKRQQASHLSKANTLLRAHARETRAKVEGGSPELPAWTERAPPLSSESPEVIGFVWYRELLGREGPPLHTCQRDYAWIGGQKPADRLQVAKHVRATTWAASNLTKVTTSHVVRFWASYLEGPRNGPQQVIKVSPKSQAYERMKAAEKAYREAQRYEEPTEKLMAAWKAATEEWKSLPEQAVAS